MPSVDGVLAGVGDRAAADQGQPAGCRAGRRRRLWTRSQLTRGCSAARSRSGRSAASRPRREAVAAARSSPARLERLRRQVAVRVRPPDQGEQGRHRPSRPSPTRRRPAGPGRRGSWSARGSPRRGRRPSRGPGPPVRAGRPASCGMSRPLLVWPTRCPARPTRWSPRATLPGDSTWQTRSTAPMSMPSSSDAVATTAGSWPSFSASSVSCRSSRARLPWCGDRGAGRLARRSLRAR